MQIKAAGLFPLVMLGSLAATSPSQAEPPSDTSSIWTLQDENSSITTAQLNDKYYVNGFRLGWTSPTGDLPSFVSDLGQIWGETGQQRLSINIQQSIFTPADTFARPPDPADRPYAGVLTVDASLIQDTDASRSILGVEAGLVGPDALGRQVQNGFHDIIKVGQVRGWAYQIHDEPLVEFLGQKIWRLPLDTIDGFEVDALPNLEAGLGNLRVYGLGGGVVRFGEGLDSDFGVARVRPGLTGSDAFVPTRDFAWNVFFGLDGQLVAHDITIDGNTYRSSPNASLYPVVGELEGGLSIIFSGVRLSYTHVLQTHESRGQRGGLHQFGSLALSARF